MEKEEEIILDHVLHEHPLTLIQNCGPDDSCRCCSESIVGETAYGCSSSRCENGILLHQECAEMPIQIRHPMHPHHILSQKTLSSRYIVICTVCSKDIFHIAYCCAFQNCQFTIHLGCTSSTGLVSNVKDDSPSIWHNSHPQHALRLLRRNRRWCSFKCDACGTIEKRNSYICITCQYWIHESCASLLPVITRENLHHHTLSLSFDFPIKYTKFQNVCDVCGKKLWRKYWIYHCELCSYAVHIKCAMNPSPNSSSHLIDEASVVDGKGMMILQLPKKDVVEELIKPFVIREGGEIAIPQSMNGGVYTFRNHEHPLSLNLIDDDDEEELICDGCVTPICQKKTSSDDCYYLSCSECKYYFLHWACFHLPLELTSLPRVLHDQTHKLILKSVSSKLSFEYCHLCELHTNGLFYACTECRFEVDIKCASLSNTIKHSAHPHHLLLTMGYLYYALCGACGMHLTGRYYYKCGNCPFKLHIKCALLPAAIKHRWDEHPLPLTYDAKINHPQDFYCDICEGNEMNPNYWMYHCRDCDHSFHPLCLTATAGRYRNVKLGQQYVFTTFHPHPLTYQLVTIKPRCSLCKDYTYDKPGFQCELCNFVMCRREGIQATHE